MSTTIASMIVQINYTSHYVLLLLKSNEEAKFHHFARLVCPHHFFGSEKIMQVCLVCLVCLVCVFSVFSVFSVCVFSVFSVFSVCMCV
jgi:hypothetical protein